MSIQIFQDSENIPGLGKKNKRGDENGMKTNIPKPTKRVALGNITNQVHGSRIQPSRAAKEKHKVCLRFGGLSLTYFCHRTCLTQKPTRHLRAMYSAQYPGSWMFKTLKCMLGWTGGWKNSLVF